MKTSKHLVVAAAVLMMILSGCTQKPLTTIEAGSAITPQASQETKNVDAITSQENENVHSEAIVYYGTTEGFYAEPTAEGNYPGVVMIHEWWGLNDNIKEMAKKLAQEGYKVLAVDLYNGHVATTSEEAQKLVGGLDQPEAVQNLQAAVAYLRNHDTSKIASLGWCFGGGQSLQLALSGEKLNATVMYYGQPVMDKDKLASITWPLLGIFGAEDTSIPVAKVEEFKTALNDGEIENNITIYPGVGHAFANPSGANYAPKETQDAWDKTLNFLKENLKG